MFGNSSSPTKESHSAPVAEHPLSKPTIGLGSIPDGVSLRTDDEAESGGEKRNSISASSTSRKSQEDGSPTTEKKRRSSGVAKASALFSSAKNSLHIHGASNNSNPDSPLTPQPTAIQKLGKTDPALSVPQGSLNNSAGESRPGPRSTFRVGVTEDKNKKCRRTMEDTHAYLYNFLSTPAPTIGAETDSPSSSKRSLGPREPDELTHSSSQSSHVVETDNGYFAIFDGHAGTFAADWCGKKLHVLLEDMIRKHPNTPVPELLDSTFTSVDQQLETLPLKNSGCTAICAVLRWEDRIPNSQSATGSTAIAPAAAAALRAVNAENSNSSFAPEPSQNLTPEAKALVSNSTTSTAIPKLQETASRQRVLYTANVGDARIVLCRNGKALRLSYDHKGSDENEGKRISNAGGLILNNRVNGVLAVTRALGDSYMKDLVTGHPYTTETVIQPDIDEFLILACDGLWDVCSDQEAVDLVRHTQDPQVASKQLVDHALARFSTDNLSCMLVRFDGKAVQQTVERKAEAIGVEGDPPTKQGGISEADAIVKEARKSMGDLAKGEEFEETKRRVSQDIIREEVESEPGPELNPEGTKHFEVLQQTLRRSYADAIPPVTKRRGRGFLRWSWRAVYISALGGVGYMSYVIYMLRTPDEQFNPDPSKKTLVILGTGWGSVSLLKKLDTENYNVIVISPRNFFLFTPLLPSCTTGTIEHRSIMEPIRNILRHKKATVKYYEAEATKIDYERKVVHINDESEIKGDTSSTEVPFDMLVVGVGAENATFGIPGVREHSCFLKEVGDAQQIRKRIMDCVETASFKDQSPEERKRLLHMVVVGGGPTGVEFAGELQDFFEQDLKKWIPEIVDNFHVTLVEALPNVLPMFSKQLIDYTESTFKEESISIRTKTMVKKVTDKYIEAEFTKPDGTKQLETLPYGLLVWATGNALRPVVKDLMSQIPAQKDSRRGLSVNEYLVVNGTENVWAVGDCAIANYAPTAQVASQEGAFLARLFNSLAKTETINLELASLSNQQSKAPNPAARNEIFENIKALQKSLRRVKQIGPFEYSHQGSLAYIGSERAVADISWLSGNFASGGTLTYLFWKSAYLNMCFSTRNRVLVCIDWMKARLFGRDVSRE
ncbi:MAG: hypothetical protein Q9199_006074 [Rusavskia elegans]